MGVTAMATTQSISRIAFAKTEVERYEDDVNTWKLEQIQSDTLF